MSFCPSTIDTSFTLLSHFFLRLINIVIEFEGYAAVVGELQIHYRPILELKVR